MYSPLSVKQDRISEYNITKAQRVSTSAKQTRDVIHRLQLHRDVRERKSKKKA